MHLTLHESHTPDPDLIVVRYLRSNATLQPFSFMFNGMTITVEVRDTAQKTVLSMLDDHAILSVNPDDGIAETDVENPVIRHTGQVNLYSKLTSKEVAEVVRIINAMYEFKQRMIPESEAWRASFKGLNFFRPLIRPRLGVTLQPKSD